jgi:cytoskeletal protein CcmA (bactofilin family)
MKRAKYLLIALLLALPILAWVSVAHAQSFRSGNNVTVASGQVVNSTLFATGQTVDIAGTVNGDVFCAGQSVTVSGRVNGDVICAGQDLTVTGTVTGDVRLAGQQVTLGAAVGGNATIGAETYSQTSNGKVDGDLSVGANQATLNGRVGRDVAAGGTTLIVANVVGRNVQFAGTNVKLASNARVGGSINYTSNNTLQKSNGAIVAGSVTKHAPSSKQEKHVWPFSWLFALYIFVSCLIAALLLVLLFPRMFEHTARTARAHMGKTFLVGLLASIIVPALLMVLLVTIIGIPFALLAGLIWLLLGILATPTAAYLLGHYILSGSRNAILIMLVGAAILFLLYLLPFIGFLVWLLAEWFGLGALLLQSRRVGMPHYNMEALPETADEKR